MPDDIKDPEGMFGYYYDNRYDQALNTFEPGSLQHSDETIQSMAEEITGKKLSPEKLKAVREEMEDSGYFRRNVGDPTFRNKVEKILSKHAMVRKVINAFRSK
jgi:hypothetical protein